jgi:hypothetical protein
LTLLKHALKQRKGIQYQQRLNKLIKQFEQGDILADTLLDSMMAWNNHASYGNTLGLRKALFSSLPENIAIKAAERFTKILERKNASDRYKYALFGDWWFYCDCFWHRAVQK